LQAGDLLDVTYNIGTAIYQASAFGIATLVKFKTTPFCKFNQQILAQKSIKWPPSQGAEGRS
jgi:hypothetical protein